MALNRARHSRKGTPAPVEDAPSEAAIDVFLKTFEETFSEYESRRKARISRVGLAKLKEDPAFVARMVEVLTEEDIVERLRAKAIAMAIKHGSKDLLINELKARLPEVYGNKATVTVKVDVTKLSDDELRDLVERYGKGQ